MIKQSKFMNKVIFISFMFLAFSAFLQYRGAEAVSSDKSEKISCGKTISGGEIQVYESVECGKEQELSSISGGKLYQRQVLLKKQFKKHVKANRYDVKAEVQQKFKFTYDKSSNISITPGDIFQDIVDSGWKISPVSEIYVDDDVCSVSNKYSVYEKNMVGNYQYVSDGYFDVFCDYNGKIGINSDIR